MTGTRRVTQAEVARLAGVSQAMVSLVVNGSDSIRVTPETRQRVEDALRETGYTVDVLGRRLRGKSNRLLGVFTYESAFPSGSGAGDFYVPFLQGIEEEAERTGYDLILFTSPGRQDGRRHVYENDGNRLRIADGCILLGRHTDRHELARLTEERFPFVFIGRRESPAGPVSYVGADYRSATEALYERMWAAGHRRIALIGFQTDSEGTVDRRAGYLASCHRHGGRPVLLDAGEQPGSIVAELWERGVSGVLVETTDMAQAVADLVSSQGRSVPGDLSIAVLGDRDPSHAIAASPGPVVENDWTGFRLPRQEMGRHAVRALVAELTRSRPRSAPTQVLLACDVVAGSTLAAPSH